MDITVLFISQTDSGTACSREAVPLRGSTGTMFKQLKSFLTENPHADPPHKGPKSIATPVPAGKDFRAISVTPGIKCCQAAKSGVGERHLMREAPRLPLPGCTMPASCSCRFKKASDRRDSDGDRRELGMSETGRWFAGQEKRTRRNRRSGKG
jgi:hypothetical protein